jgi:hypothetical protein
VSSLVPILLIRVATIKARPRLPSFYLSVPFATSLAAFCISAFSISVAAFSNQTLFSWPQGRAGYARVISYIRRDRVLNEGLVFSFSYTICLAMVL